MQVSYDSSGIKVMARVQSCFFVMPHSAIATGSISVHPQLIQTVCRLIVVLASHESMERIGDMLVDSG